MCRLLGLLALSVLGFACSSDDGDSPSGTEGTATSDVGTTTVGTSGSGEGTRGSTGGMPTSGSGGQGDSSTSTGEGTSGTTSDPMESATTDGGTTAADDTASEPFNPTGGNCSRAPAEDNFCMSLGLPPVAYACFLVDVAPTCVQTEAQTFLVRCCPA